MDSTQVALLRRIYVNASDIYLEDITPIGQERARATFVFGDNPRTNDYTHVGAAEMLAGVSQAAYCMTQREFPTLITEYNIAHCYFNKHDIKFTKMLAPNSRASLDLGISLQPNGLPKLSFEGFISGSVECALTDSKALKVTRRSQLTASATRTLRTFYNNDSELTLKEITPIAGQSWRSLSTFSRDPRLKSCEYTTSTQLIIGLSQLAFAVVGETIDSRPGLVEWSVGSFRESMSDQTLVKMSITRSQSADLTLGLTTSLGSARNIKGCKFFRLKLAGTVAGTLDNMLSPRVPVKSVRV
ncbi:MAG: hypothetical protein ACK5GN_10325 [Pseudomonadota bacterium]|jgi:hypothetical protein